METRSHWLENAIKPRRMLLIDDSECETQIIVKLSKGFNIDWEVVHTGVEALAKLQNSKTYHLVVLDLKLQGDPQGVQLFEKIKLVCPSCPVLVLSGHINSEVFAEITSIGFALFGQKPQAFDSKFFSELFQALNIPTVAPGLKEETTTVGNI